MKTTVEEFLNKKVKQTDGYDFFYVWLEFQPVDYTEKKIREWMEEYAQQQEFDIKNVMGVPEKYFGKEQEDQPQGDVPEILEALNSAKIALETQLELYNKDKTVWGYGISALSEIKSAIKKVEDSFPIKQQEEKRSCPCLYGEPCKPNCSCVNPFSSAGCECCCTYGSLEQREAKAKHLKSKLQQQEVTEESKVMFIDKHGLHDIDESSS